MTTRRSFLGGAAALAACAVRAQDRSPTGDPALDAIQRELDEVEPADFKAYCRPGDPLELYAPPAEPPRFAALRRLDDAFRTVQRAVAETVVPAGGPPAVWYVYNMGVVVKTPQTVFAIDLLHRQGPLMEPLLDFALVTHNHDDHADDALLALMDRHRKTVVSNFLCNYGAHKGGEMPGGYIRGEGTLEIGDVKIRATPSDHNGYLREFTSAFEITVGDWTLYHTGDSWRPSMLNPARPPDLWVCHPRNGLDIVKCVSKFHPRRTVIAHLNELGHQGGGRVSVADALETAAAIEAEGAEAVIPVWGERIQ
jgi:L-ascorbate metabolism protein UlaG (beta-lactamase superfamily)